MEKFEVKTENFEGPLDLLLELIEKRKMHISEVSLSAIAEDYLSHIENRQPFPVDSASQFILISATLLLIKSKSLLPTLDLTQEEEKSVEELELRLKIYKEIKDVSEEILEKYGKRVIFPTAPMPRITSFAPGGNLDLNTIQSALNSVLKNLPEAKKEPEARVKKIISLEEMIEKLKARIERAMHFTFKDFVGLDKSERVEVVIGFLALLELVKRGAVSARQESRFGDINLNNESVGLPKYE